MKYTYLFFLAALFFFSCQNGNDNEEATVIEGNPPAEGFNAAASDEKAIAIADEVMEAMGGRTAWEATRYIRWTFFGRRTLLWDKQTGNVRIDMPADTNVYLLNVFDKTGKIQRKGKEESNPDTLSKYLGSAEGIWINDSYWLVMPFKLKDSGVTLKYVGQDTMLNGKDADVLQLTFEEVGKTPENKYLVYVDTEERLVRQWDFYTKATDETPRFSTPWDDYKKEGQILLSGNRGRGQLTDIKVLESVDEAAFTEFTEPVLE